MAATGTDNQTAGSWQQRGQEFGQQYGGGAHQNGPDIGEQTAITAEAELADGDSPQVLTLARNEKSRHLVADTGEKRRAWDSNPQPVTRHLISSQCAYLP